MRGRQQVYPTFECAPNRLHPDRRNRRGHAHFSRPRMGMMGLCPLVWAGSGHALPGGAGTQLGYAGKFRYSSICF